MGEQGCAHAPEADVEEGEMGSEVFLQIMYYFYIGTAVNCFLPGQSREQEACDLKAAVMGQPFVTVAAVQCSLSLTFAWFAEESQDWDQLSP